MKSYHYCAPLLIAVAGSAHAATPLNLKTIAASVDGEYLSYSGAFGSRRIVNTTTGIDLGTTNLSLNISQGDRKAGDDKFKAMRVSATLVHDWSARLSTRTTAGIASDKPVFVTRELVQEVSYKPLRQTVLTVGGRYSRYFGGQEALSWSAGAAQYFRGGSINYRFSSFHVQHVGHTTGHLLGVKVKDPLGASQLWLGHGTALNDALWLPTVEKGKNTSVELRRVQPIGAGIGLMVGVNRSWYNTESTKYHGTGVRFGLTFGK